MSRCVLTLLCGALTAAAVVAQKAKEPDRDAFADTPEKQAALAKAKASVAGVQNFDYFTTGHYIVIYGWVGDKPRHRSDALAKAVEAANDLEALHEVFARDFPPHPKTKPSYPVYRRFANHDQRHSYFAAGNGQGARAQGRTMARAGDIVDGFQGAWYHYAYCHFGDGVEPHPWFLLGLATHYQRYDRQGGKFVHQEPKQRLYGQSRNELKSAAGAIEAALRIDWPTAEADHLGFTQRDVMKTLAEFLKSGVGTVRKADPSWGSILDVYTRTLLETRQPAEAQKKAFAGVDFEKLHDAFAEWALRK